ncbi:ATP-binding protein [Stenotrophomonas rhizophila]
MDPNVQYQSGGAVKGNDVGGESSSRKFKVDARVLLSLGRESIKDQTTALMELVKNAYDADAENVQIEIPEESDVEQILRIKDDGLGMSSNDINEKWLRIGYSHKRVNRLTSQKGRRATGEKGVGRLSADRLGAALELRSRTQGQSVAVAVDWDDFDVDGAELGSVSVKDLVNVHPELPTRSSSKGHGTELIISKLRQSWSSDEIESLEVELSTLIPPDSPFGKGEFSIWMKKGKGGELQSLVAPFTEDSQLEMHGDFDATGRLSYRITEKPIKPGGKRHQVKQGKIPWLKLSGAKEAAKFDIGRVSISLKFYLRAGVSLKEFNIADLREYLDTYGGVRIYRDNVRVKPYGDPANAEGDWLGLSARKTSNPAAASRKGYRFSANQLMGSVFIGRDSNPLLKDSAAREGLVHGHGYSQLRAAVLSSINLLEVIYHERFTKSKGDGGSPDETLPDVVGDIKAGLKEVREELAKVGQGGAGTANDSASRLLLSSVEKIDDIAKRVLQAEREIEDLAGQATVYRGLATVGISSAVFGHETESALAQAKISTGLAQKLLGRDVPKIEAGLGEIAKASRAIERVSVWGQFALARVKKDKRRRVRVDVSKIILHLVEEMRPLFEASSIELKANIKSVLEMRAFQMDIEALTLNLLTNAYYAAGRSVKNRKVLVEVVKGTSEHSSLIIVVEDSGPGIAKEHISQIWAPLFPQGQMIKAGLLERAWVFQSFNPSLRK